jgi:hypothetical protein
MNKERQDVAWAVLQGSLPADKLTYSEITELNNLIFDAVANKLSLPLFDSKMH